MNDTNKSDASLVNTKADSMGKSSDFDIPDSWLNVEPASISPSPAEISGWLAFAGVVIILNLLVSLFQVVTWDHIYNNWRYPATAEYILAVFVVKLGLCIALTVLFFKRQSHAVHLAILYFAASSIWPFMEHAMYHQFLTMSPLQVVGSLPWIFYFIYSKRVRNTLTK